VSDPPKELRIDPPGDGGIDLTDEPPSESGLSSPKLGPFNAAKTQEWIRSGLAVALVLLLAAVILLPLWRAKDIAAEKELLQTLLSPLVGLVGAVVGFYYGRRS
jgi:hypothetical protein